MTTDPDGSFIATVLQSKLAIRATRSLEVTRVVNLPNDISTSVQFFLWSPTSRRLLIASQDVIKVFSVLEKKFVATINNPTSGTTKTTAIAFGATDDEILVFTEFGLKLTIFNLSTSTANEVPAPKFYNAANSAKGFAIRSTRDQWALLTRSAGKDIISIHAAGSAKVIRSWAADSIDAQNLSYSPDGRWLAVCEAAAQGHRIFFYTADGHLYKTWKGPNPSSIKDSDSSMGAGLRFFEWNSTGDMNAMGDFSPNISILAAPTFSEVMKLRHVTIIKPTEGLQIWQEQLSPSPSGGIERNYVAVQQVVYPSTSNPSPAAKDTSAPNGTNLLTFDASGTLLASRVDNMPTTLWIWDLRSRQVRAVLLQHSPITRVIWHPHIPEILMIRSEGDENRGFIHLWEPSWDRPRVVDFKKQLAGGKILGRTVALWLGLESAFRDQGDGLNTALPTIFFSDSQDYLLAAITEADDDNGEGQVPWENGNIQNVEDITHPPESPLVLAGEESSADRMTVGNDRIRELVAEGESLARLSANSDGVDDTFHFRKFIT